MKESKGESKGDLKWDLKLIIIIICIEAIVAIFICLSYNLIVGQARSGNYMTENVYSLNNDNPKKQEGWIQLEDRQLKTGQYVVYQIPSEWDTSNSKNKLDGITLESNVLKIGYLPEDTKYEDFLKKFMETLENKKSYPGELEYTLRELNFNNQNFLIIEEGYSYRSMYFCLAKEEYAYYLKVRVREDCYKPQLINTINDIFSTYRVY